MSASEAASMSASGMTTMWFFAPPSACTRLPLTEPVENTYFAIGVEPTKLTADTRGSVSSVSTASLSPFRTFSTPGGAPASSMSSARRSGQDGSFSEGLSTKLLPQRIQVHSRRNVVGELALHQMRDSAGELHHFQAALDRALGVRKHLAVLGGDGERQLVQVALDQLLEAEHHARARDRGSLRPAGEGLLCIGYGALGLRLRGERHLARKCPGGGIEHVAEAPAFTADMLAADEMGQFLRRRRGLGTQGGAVVARVHGIGRRWGIAGGPAV